MGQEGRVRVGLPARFERPEGLPARDGDRVEHTETRAVDQPALTQGGVQLLRVEHLAGFGLPGDNLRPPRGACRSIAQAGAGDPRP